MTRRNISGGSFLCPAAWGPGPSGWPASGRHLSDSPSVAAAQRAAYAGPSGWARACGPGSAAANLNDPELPGVSESESPAADSDLDSDGHARSRPPAQPARWAVRLAGWRAGVMAGRSEPARLRTGAPAREDVALALRRAQRAF